MISEKDETEQRTRRTAGTAGAMGTAAAVGVAAGVAAGALLDDATEPEEATHAPAARDPFDDLVPPAPAATPAAAEAETLAATAEARSVIDTDDSVNPVVTNPPTDTTETGAAPMPPAAAAPVPASAPAPAPAPVVTDAPVIETPAAPPTVADQPAVLEEPVVEPPVVEEPVADQPPFAAHPTEPPAVLPPFEDTPIGGGMEPMEPTGPMDPIVLGDPIDILPPAPADPMPPVADGPTDDPLAPMPMEPEIEPPAPFDAPTDGFDGEGVDGPERPMLPPEPVAMDPIAVDPIAPTPELPVLPEPVTPEPIVVDVVVQNAAMDAVAAFGKYVQGFGDVPFKELGVMDKGEFWRAIKQLDPTLTGYVTELSFAVQKDLTLAEIADIYDVNIAELATMVDLDPNGAATFAELLTASTSPNLTITPGLLSFDVDGQTFQITANGQLLMEDAHQEGAFHAVDVDLPWTDHPTDDNYGWLLFSDTSEGAQINPTLD